MGFNTVESAANELNVFHNKSYSFVHNKVRESAQSYTPVLTEQN